MTDRKWTANETRVYTGDGGFDIRNLPNATERAAFIVKAVNNHEALVKALEKIAYPPPEGGCGPTLGQSIKIAQQVLALVGRPT